MSVILFCTIASFSVFAAGSGAIAMSSETAQQGSSVTLNVNMSKNPGLLTMTIEVSYDTSVLQLAKVTDTKLLVGSELNPTYGSPYTICWVDGSSTANNTKTGNIASFTFKVLDSAKVGKTNVTLKFIDSFDTNYGANTFTVASGSVTVTCKTHSYGSYSKKDNANHTRTCTKCGYIETSAHSWNGGSVTKAASCKEAGVKTYTCTADGCGATKTEAIAKTNDHSFSNWNRTKEPTCEGKGEQIRTCSKCGAKETKEIAALGHSFPNPTVTKQPTCTEAGEESGKCTRCGRQTTNKIPATGHKVDKYVVTKAATCTETGEETGTCTVCGKKDVQEIPAKGHQYGEPVVVTPATETAPGKQTKTCGVCGDVIEEEIPMLSTDPEKPTDGNETTTSQITDVSGETEETISISTTNSTDSSFETASEAITNTGMSDSDPSNGGLSIWWIWLITALAVVGGGVAVFFIVKKKKSAKAE